MGKSGRKAYARCGRIPFLSFGGCRRRMAWDGGGTEMMPFFITSHATLAEEGELSNFPTDGPHNVFTVLSYSFPPLKNFLLICDASFYLSQFGYKESSWRL